MFDPNLGRFIQPDPIGFDGGDHNLYRFVGNHPTNATDPSGLQEVELGGMKYDLPECFHFSRIFFGPNSKENGLKGIPFCRKKDLPGLPPGFKREVLNGGRGWAGVVPNGIYVGPDGCGPCVGLVLIPPKPDMPTYVLHFSAPQDVDQCFIRVGILDVGGYDGSDSSLRVRWEIKPGYRAIICGAEQNETKSGDSVRLHTLGDVTRCLRRWDVPIDKYIPAPGFAVDKNGNVYWTTAPGIPVDKYEK